jgi:serine/threonine-protein kinase HipA
MTAHALSFVPALSDSARVFDMGCGPGRAALILASNLKTAVVAVDLVPSFLDQLRQSASAAGLDQKIEPRLANMSELDEPAESIDLIWAEGAVYNIGFDNALKTWRHLLKPEGTIACSELSWLTDRPSEEAAAFWRENYPAMRTKAENIEASERLGYRCLMHLVFPESCWWEEYYGPLKANVRKLTATTPQDSLLAKNLKRTEKEISVYERNSKDYSYVFYILQKAG